MSTLIIIVLFISYLNRLSSLGCNLLRPSICSRIHRASGFNYVKRTEIASRLKDADEDTPIPININGKSMKGYYVRPSRAIEKGGGFFVPGLEGDRYRIK